RELGMAVGRGDPALASAIVGFVDHVGSSLQFGSAAAALTPGRTGCPAREICDTAKIPNPSPSATNPPNTAIMPTALSYGISATDRMCGALAIKVNHDALVQALHSAKPTNAGERKRPT